MLLFHYENTPNGVARTELFLRTAMKNLENFA